VYHSQHISYRVIIAMLRFPLLVIASTVASKFKIKHFHVVKTNNNCNLRQLSYICRKMSKIYCMISTDKNISDKLNKELITFFKHSNFAKTNIYSVDNLTYNDFLSNKMLMIYIIRQGVPYSIFNLIQKSTPFSENDWADILDLSTKSLQRYKQNSKQFKSLQSEKIIEMAEVTNIGIDVFGDMDKFKLWLDTPNFALGNIKPFELLKDSYGKEMIIGELTRINYGILS